MNRLLSRLLCCSAVLLAAAHASAQTLPDYVPTDGLVGWWPFNGNANDESGNGNHGFNFGANLDVDRFGNSNSSYQFDGIESRIAFNMNSIDNIFLTGIATTSSIWIRTIDLHGPLISMQGSNGTEYDFHIGTLADVVQNPGHVGILIRDNCCGTGNNLFGGNCADDSWHMLTVVRLPDGMLYIYKDAVLEAISATGQNGNLLFDAGFMSFGADYSWIVASPYGCLSCNSNDQQHYAGHLDDIGIWNRALNPEEILALYSGASPIAGCTDATACNFNPEANVNDGSCVASGCLEPAACNFNPSAGCAGEACDYTCCPGPGCCGVGTVWDAEAGICVPWAACPDVIYNPDFNSDGMITVADLLALLAIFEDVDSDGDGIFDSMDDCFGVYDGCGVCGGVGVDADDDGICDNEDPCVGTTDVVGVCGGSCTADADADGVCDTSDPCGRARRVRRVQRPGRCVHVRLRGHPCGRLRLRWQPARCAWRLRWSLRGRCGRRRHLRRFRSVRRYA